jgi:hypothetical protein
MHSSGQPSTFLILLLIAIAVGVLAVALSNPHARRVLVGLIIGGVLFFLFVSVSWYRVSESPAEVAAVRIPTPDEGGIPIGQAEMADVKPAGDTKEPEWIKVKRGRLGDAYYEVISSGELADPSMSKENLDVRMAAAAERHVADVLGEPNMAEKLHIDANYIRNSCVAGEHVAEDNGHSETFVRLKFDRRFDDEVKKRYREHLSTSRVEKLGGATLGVLGVIAAALAYLRFMKPREDGIKRGE